MPFELRIALRYLVARRKQSFISVISFISVLGIAVGVMALFVALGLMTGLQQEIRSKILGTTAHVSVFRSGAAGIDDYRAVTETARKVPGVEGAAPVVYGKGLLTTPGGAAVATLKGVDPAFESSVTDLAAQVVKGSFASLEDHEPGAVPPVLLGDDLADTLGVSVGDVVSATSPHGRLSPMGVLPRVTRLRVAGTVRTGLFEFDSAWAYLPMAAAQRLFLDGEDRASLVELRIADMYAVREAGDGVTAALGEGYVTTNWIAMNQSLFSALWLEKMAIGFTIGLIVAVAAMNIIATLILLVMEKQKDIAILVSMGASRRSIQRVFVLQGAIIGAVGTLTGAALGWAACRLLDHYRLIRVPADVYQISYVPFTLLPGDAVAVVAGALLISLSATTYPAWRASRLVPAEGLRND